MDDALNRLRLTQQAEQSSAALVEFAGALGAYMTALLRHGFEREEAIELVLSYQTMTLSAGFVRTLGGDE